MQTTYAVTYAFAIFLLASSLFGAVLGLLLMFRLKMYLVISRAANRWIPTSGFEHMLDHSVNMERWFHRNHRVTGIFIVSGALCMLIYFGDQFDSVLGHLGAALPASFPVVLLDALVPLALLCAALALCAGLVLWLRPGRLKGIETFANRWISVQRIVEVLDARYNAVDDLVRLYARQTGMLLVVASAWLFFLMLGVLL